MKSQRQIFGKNPLLNKIGTLRNITIGHMFILIFLSGFTLNVSINAPIQLLEPYDIEINSLQIISSTPDLITSTTEFQSTMIVTITKLIYPPQHYQVVYGYRTSRLNSDSTTGTLKTRIYGPSNGNTKQSPSFQFKYYHYEQASINSIQINYMLIGKALLDTLLVRSYYIKIDSPDLACNGLTATINCPYIKPISLAHLNYKTYLSMTGITYTKNISPTTNLLRFDIKISSITRSSLGLNLEAKFLNIVTFQLYFLAIDNEIFDLSNLTSTLMVEHLNNLPAAGTYLHLFPQTINSGNYFIGISKYQGEVILLTDFRFEIAFPTPQKRVSGWLSSYCKGLNIFVLAMYGYAPPCKLYRNCLQCYARPDLFCTQCKHNFNLVPLPGGNSDCQCQAPLQLVSGICDTIPFGCTIAQRLSDNSIRCHLCDPMKFLKLNPTTHSCECYQNYFMDANQTCQDYCGDGFNMQSQCDDGNQASGDGCSSTCELESGFTCDTSVHPNKCKSSLILLYKIESILKNSKSNSAVIKLHLKTPSMYTFPVLRHHFEPVQSHLKLKIILSHHPYLDVPINDLTLLSVNEKNQIEIQFSFAYSIEDFEGFIQLNYEMTNYANYTQALDFRMVGDNLPLKFEDKVDIYQKMGFVMLTVTILKVLFMFISIISPKFIGLESVLVLQLCFFSQILVKDNKKFPIGFLFLENLQYSAGFNRIIDLTYYIPITQDSIKMNHIKRQKFIIENFNINFIFMFLSFVCLAISFIIRTRNERMVELNKENQIQNSNNDALQIRQEKPHLKKINDLLYFLSNQVAFWLFLPLLSTISAKLQIEDFTLTTDLQGSNFTMEIILSNLTAVLGFFFILSIILNNFQNIWLSYQTVKIQHERPQECTYKKILSIYLLVVGSLVFFANYVYFYHIYCSSIVLVLHLIFMFLTIVLDPYRYSLKVHTIGMIINHVIYLVFLIVINIINYIDSIHHDISLLFGYTMLGLCLLSSIFQIIRLYYQLRYGKQLEDQLAEERMKKEIQQKIKRTQILKRKRAKLENEVKKKLSQIEKKRDFNFYLYENQIKQDKQNELIEWLQNRPFLDQKAKERQYFQNFIEKPLKWYKKYEPQTYNQKMNQISEHLKTDKERDRQKKDDKNYNMITSNLRKQVDQAKKKKGQDLNEKEKKLRTMPDYAMNVIKRGEDKYLHKAYDLRD